MNQDICLHAINTHNNYNLKLSNQKLTNILRSNALLSRKLQGINDSKGFNGIDYISLCDYQKRNIHPINHQKYTSFEAYIRDSISLIFPKDKLEIITPTIIDIITTSKQGYRDMAYLGMSSDKRYSDLFDEVQVKNKISLDLMCGITFPFHKVNNSLFGINQNTRTIIKQLSKIKRLLVEYNHDVPIYDIDTMHEIRNEEDIRKLVKKYY